MTATPKKRLRQKLMETRDELMAWSRKISEPDWTQPVYSHGEEWTALDVLRHLTWAEGGMARLIVQIRRGEEGAPADFDLDRYNARGVQKFADKTPAELMELMAQNREWILDLLQELSQEELQRQGRHGSGRTMTIAQVFEQIADHERQHLHDLRQTLDAG